MQISTTSGHLTATNKQHIKAIFDAGLQSATVNRITYHIAQTGHKEYGVLIQKMETPWCELKAKLVTHKATFTV